MDDIMQHLLTANNIECSVIIFVLGTHFFEEPYFSYISVAVSKPLAVMARNKCSIRMKWETEEF